MKVTKKQEQDIGRRMVQIHNMMKAADKMTKAELAQVIREVLGQIEFKFEGDDNETA